MRKCRYLGLIASRLILAHLWMQNTTCKIICAEYDKVLLPTSGRQNTVKTAPQPLFVNIVALYVSIISPVGPILISPFVFELEAEE